MAGTAFISSSFVIQCRPSDNVGTVITNPGRSFRVIAVGANNADGANPHNVTVAGAANIVNGESAAAGAYTMLELVDATMEVASGQNLTVTVAAGGANDVDQVDIYCVATGGGEALTAT